MRRTSAIIVMCISCSTCLAVDLEQRINLMWTQKWPIQHCIAYLGKRAGYEVEIAPGCLNDPKTVHPRTLIFCGGFGDISIRHALSWVLHFADVPAVVTNGTLIVSPALDGSRLPPELSSHTETEGAWLAAITNVSSREITLRENDWDIHQLLQFLSHSTGCPNTIIHPELIPMDAKLTVSFDGVPATVAMDQVLEMIGGERKYQGSVMFLKPKEQEAQHKP